MAAFQERLPDLEALGVRVIVASVDPLEQAAGTVERLGLTFPVGHGLPLLPTAEALGAFYEVRRQILHATSFLLRPGGEIATAVYSSGPIGRITADDTLRLVQFYKDEER